MNIKILLLLLLPLFPSPCLHLYAGAQETYLISQSTSLKNIYKCKDKCFALNQTLAFPMKYVRTVWAQLGTNHMYLQGHCYLNVSSSSSSWTSWADLPQSRALSTEQQQQAWSKYNRECESKEAEMGPEIREALGLTYIHSEFENTQASKQGDLNGILKNMAMRP